MQRSDGRRDDGEERYGVAGRPCWRRRKRKIKFALRWKRLGESERVVPLRVVSLADVADVPFIALIANAAGILHVEVVANGAVPIG